MKLRALIGVHAGQVRDYSPVAARGAIASGMAELLDRDPYAVTRTEVIAVERPAPEKPKAIQSKRKG
jgi:hypothetical protein